jgi:hypothetical protein
MLNIHDLEALMAYGIDRSSAAIDNFNGRIVIPTITWNCVEVECYGCQHNPKVMGTLYVPSETPHWKFNESQDTTTFLETGVDVDM